MSLLDDLRAEGLTVFTYPNWETHAASSREFNPIGILNHWDAVTGWSLNTYFNNPRFNAPTYHVAIEKDGTVWLGSRGYVYGAGGGDSAVFRAMRDDQTVPPAKVEKDMNGNPHFWAVCVNYFPGSKNEGPGPAIPGAQYESLVKVNAALCRRDGWNPVYRANDHDGWTTRKDDLSGRAPGNWWAAPSNWDLTRFRTDVRRQLDSGGNMADHKHAPMPDDLPRSWADESWQEYAAHSETKDDTRGHTMYREDISWVWQRLIKPLEAAVEKLSEENAVLRTRVDSLEAKANGGSNVYGTVVKLTKP